jgi:hypothetical protein
VPTLVGYPQTAAGQDAGGGQVVLYNPDGSTALTATPFGSDFTAGARVVAAKLNPASYQDIAVGTGPGVSSQVVILDGKSGQPVVSLSPFEPGFTGGVFLAAGDVTGDGAADLIVTPDQGGGPVVVVYDGAALANGQVVELARFYGIADPNFRGGARSAVGDVNGDGVGDVVVAAGFGGGPRVAGFDGKMLASGDPQRVFPDFYAFEQTLRNGVFIACGDTDGDGKADVICGGGPGGGPRVTIFSAAALLPAGGSTLTPLANFFGGDPSNRGGIRVAVKDLDGDAKADLVVGSGTGAGSHFTAYLGKDITPSGTPPVFEQFDAYPGFTGGVFVG